MIQSHNSVPTYQILHEHDRTDGSHKSLDALETEYIELTDKLIYKMTHGEQVLVDGKYEQVVPTKVVFLDKSARPLAWLTRKLWDELAPTEDMSEPQQPDFKFLNIDRRHWLDTIDPQKTGQLDTSLIPEEYIIGLRSLFNKNHDGSYDAPNELDNQTIMVVDEVIATGRTLEIAKRILERAFPNSTVFGTHWMGTQYVDSTSVGNADLPVWYKEDYNDPKNEIGRGVGNRRLTADGHPSEHFLSRRFTEPDQKALRLREDFDELVSRMKQGNVLYMPYRFRDDDDKEWRSEKFNNRSYLQARLAQRAINERDSLNNLRRTS